MDQLPSEILTKIFGYLRPESLHIVSQVSKSWSRVTKVLGVCQLDFSALGDEQHDVERMVAKIIKEFPTEAAGGSIRHVLVHYHQLLPNTVFYLIQRLCPNVISFDYNYDLIDTPFSKRRHRRYSHSFLASPSWRNSIAHLPLCYNGRGTWPDYTELCQRLESLTIHGNSLLLERIWNNYYTLARSLPSLPQLTSITLYYPTAKFKEETINAIDRCCPRVSILTLHGVLLTCVSCRKGVVSYAAPNVKNLNLENVTFLNVQTFDYFPTKFPNVQSLYVLFGAIDKTNVWMTYQNLYNMIIQFKHLKNLVIRMQDEEEDDDATWFQNQMQLYQNSHKHIHIDISFV